MNYAKTNPDLAILAVNTFVKDAADRNPLIRALAVRTMGCIRVDRIVEYLCVPLRKCLKDDDPYVRKTAAICVAKMFDIDPNMVMDQGFIDALRDLICDSNPTVVANAVAAISEIASISGDKKVFVITSSFLQKLLAALNECNEWGQVFILDSLASYSPSDGREAEVIIERVTPRLQHANSAVVMSAVKVIMRYMARISDASVLRNLSRKMAPPLVTLLSAEPEIQYVALRNINLIVQRAPQILSHEIKVFFCKYNDPIYVKMEKLEIMIKLVSERNIEQVLLELKEYAQEVDVDFVRKSVRAIGRCALKLERAAERCINKLLDLIHTKVNYVVQEAIIVIKDIFRKYPNRYESIIATLCESLEELDEPEAKASMIWIIGEYAERIENADELLDSFLDTFQEETTQVQLQLLTATVKLFLKAPDNSKEMMESVLAMATEESDNPDLRDRGFVYWRLLSTDPEAARQVVLADKPTISGDTSDLDPTLLDELIANISTLASVYHKPPETFAARKVSLKSSEGDDSDGDSSNDEYDSSSSSDSGSGSGSDSDSDSDSDGESKDSKKKGKKKSNSSNPPAPSSSGGMEDLLGLGGLDLGGGSSSNGGGSSSNAGGGLDDIFGSGGGGGGASGAATANSRPVLLSGDCGFTMCGAFEKDPSTDAISLKLDFTNTSGAAHPGKFAFQFKKNLFALAPGSQGVSCGALQPGATASTTLAVAISKKQYAPGGSDPLNIAVAVMNPAKPKGQNVSYCKILLDLSTVLSSTKGAIAKSDYIPKWKSLNAPNQESNAKIGGLSSMDPEAIKQKLMSRNIFHIAQRNPGGATTMYYSARIMAPSKEILLELILPPASKGINGCKLCVKTEHTPVAALVVALVKGALTSN